MKLIAFAISLCAVVSTSCEYFTYNDCDPDCVTQAISCIIEEISKTYFNCECLVSSTACELHAKTTVVCLQPDKPRLGGEDIWIDWYNYHNRNTTTVRPTPSPRPDAPVGTKVGHIVVAGTIIIILAIFAFLVYRGIKRSSYQHVPSTPGISRQDSVYRETTQSLQEENL